MMIIGPPIYAVFANLFYSLGWVVDSWAHSSNTRKRCSLPNSEAHDSAFALGMADVRDVNRTAPDPARPKSSHGCGNCDRRAWLWKRFRHH